MRLLLPLSSYVGENVLPKAYEEIATLGEHALIVAGSSMIREGFVDELIDALQALGVEADVYDGVVDEPTDEMIDEGVRCFHENQCDYVIGLGGGSQIDAAKIIAAMSIYEGCPQDYVRQPFIMPIPPIVAIPSTAGTGSEASQYAVITDTERGVKMLLSGPSLMPRIAVVDSVLTHSLPDIVTVATAMDALTHAIEAFTSRKATAFSDIFALKSIWRIFQFLPVVHKHPEKTAARRELAQAAYEAGISFNNASLTLVHGMSRPIGALFHVPHGLANAMILSDCLSFVVDGSYKRFLRMACAIGVATPETPREEAAELFLQALDELCWKCEIPTLREYGIDREEFIEAIPKMVRDAMMSGSPTNTRKFVTPDDLRMIYEGVIER